MPLEGQPMRMGPGGEGVGVEGGGMSPNRHSGRKRRSEINAAL
jgi:hypothetical protein